MNARAQRERLTAGTFEADDLAVLGRFLNLTHARFAERIARSVDSLQNGEQGRREPDDRGAPS